MFKILGSGSSGNSALLTAGGARVLVDAGFSARKTQAMLNELGLRIEDLDAVFLTHEHGDHAKGVEGLSKRHPGLKVFANEATAETLQRGFEAKVPWALFETGCRFHFQGIEVETFRVPHDAADPVGFIFRWGGGDLFSPRRSLAWVTDLGHAPSSLPERVRDVDALVLEANYCERLLDEDTKRPWSVKQRIMGRHGHLSNQAARAFVESAERPCWEEIFLVHLSRDCNSLAAVDETFAPLRNPAQRFRISVVAPGGAGPMLETI
jgi:phosphoribosyl 1,2-cyclic phosphodiesterase